MLWRQAVDWKSVLFDNYTITKFEQTHWGDWWELINCHYQQRCSVLFTIDQIKSLKGCRNNKKSFNCWPCSAVSAVSVYTCAAVSCVMCQLNIIVTTSTSVSSTTIHTHILLTSEQQTFFVKHRNINKVFTPTAIMTGSPKLLMNSSFFRYFILILNLLEEHVLQSSMFGLF